MELTSNSGSRISQTASDLLSRVTQAIGATLSHQLAKGRSGLQMAVPSLFALLKSGAA